MTKMRNIPKLILCIASCLALAAAARAADLKVEVVVRSANIRLNPAMDSPVVGNAVLGLVLNAEKRAGEWYLWSSRRTPITRRSRGMSTRASFARSPPTAPP